VRTTASNPIEGSLPFPRILHVVLSLHPGGTERLVVELATRLHAGMPTAVCCLDELGEWAARLGEHGVAVSSLGRRPGFRPGLGAAVADAARRHRATVVHAHHYSPFVYAALARVWAPGLRLVFTEHGRLSDAPPSGRRRFVNRVLSRAPHRVFAVSEDLKQHLIAEGFAAGAVGVIYNGVDLGRPPTPTDRERMRAMLGIAGDTLLIGTVARLDPVKDIGTLIDAAGYLLPERRVRLVIVGDGPEMGRLKQAARARGVSAETTFLGHQDNVRDWLAGFDLFVNSSTSEGLSLTILEAMAMGLPVVATRVGGTPEVVSEGCGRLVAPRDAAGLADAIRALASDASLRRTMGEASRRRVEERFTLERMLRQYAGIYRRLVAAPTISESGE
jgi:glycosyltransferase involved in cell wall biosynthesis